MFVIVEGCFLSTNDYALLNKKCQGISLSSGAQITYCLSASTSESEIVGPHLFLAVRRIACRQHQGLATAARRPIQRMVITYVSFLLDKSSESSSYRKKSLR